MNPEAILKAARQIGEQLPYLLGPEADNVAPKLRAALASQDPESAAVLVMVALNPYQSTREWMAVHTSMGTAFRGYEPLAGDPKAPPPPRPVFVCADPGCTCEWVRTLGVGEPIPSCHGKPMVPKR